MQAFEFASDLSLLKTKSELKNETTKEKRMPGNSELLLLMLFTAL